MSKPTALIVDDDEDFRDSLALLVEREGFACRTAGSLQEALARIAEQAPDVVLLDMQLPDGNSLAALEEQEALSSTQVVMVTGHASVDTAVQALHKGAADYLPKPVDRGRLSACLAQVARTRALRSRVDGLRGELRKLGRFDGMIGRSKAMQQVYDLIDRVAPTEATVLITGESGVGKELVAQTIHRLSKRSEGPLVALNCGAVPANLMESELFGHERGAFTGAEKRRDGQFSLCRGGTLFLDEITEMPIELQVKLLRVLETRTFQRVGGSETLAVDARILAACNVPPDQAVADGKLREDLYYRLNVFPILVPPLQARGEDVVLLAEHFLAEQNEAQDEERAWTAEALDALRARRWPGNVRELKNLVSRACILADGDLGADLVTDPAAGGGAAPARSGGGLRPGGAANGGHVEASGDTIAVPVGSRIRDMERKLIEATLERCGGDKTRTAETLGISVKTLYNRLNVYAAASSAEGDDEG